MRTVRVNANKRNI